MDDLHGVLHSVHRLLVYMLCWYVYVYVYVPMNVVTHPHELIHRLTDMHVFCPSLLLLLFFVLTFF